MRRFWTCLVVTLVLVPLSIAPAHAQAIPALGTRAQGMGGAFVGVADDASAVYWNPAGLARGAYFSLVLDGSASEAIPDGGSDGSNRSSWLLALSMPALGLSYYRLQTATAQPAAGGFRMNTLVTHHVGATLVQSLTPSIAVGSTVKVVRGVAASGVVGATDAEHALDDWDVVGQTGSRFDADLGVMLSGEWGRVGLVARNLTEPEFRTGSDLELTLERQVRAGASVVLLPNWILAADADLTRQRIFTGDIREVSVGTEGQVTRRLTTRAGLRFNTAGDGGRAPSYSVGASFAAFGSVLVDAHVTEGDERAFRGWGLAARFVF
jgi:hypothetical protein